MGPWRTSSRNNADKCGWVCGTGCGPEQLRVKTWMIGGDQKRKVPCRLLACIFVNLVFLKE
jgi:hypothetical protein